MINSQQVEKAVARIGIALIVTCMTALFIWNGKQESDIADIYENEEKSYCELVGAGTIRHWNTDIDCTIWL